MTSCDSNETSTYSKHLWGVTGLLIDRNQRLWNALDMNRRTQEFQKLEVRLS